MSVRSLNVGRATSARLSTRRERGPVGRQPDLVWFGSPGEVGGRLVDEYLGDSPGELLSRGPPTRRGVGAGLRERAHGDLRLCMCHSVPSWRPTRSTRTFELEVYGSVGPPWFQPDQRRASRSVLS
jgi:hypothetical protein